MAPVAGLRTKLSRLTGDGAVPAGGCRRVGRRRSRGVRGRRRGSWTSGRRGRSRHCDVGALLRHVAGSPPSGRLMILGTTGPPGAAGKARRCCGRRRRRLRLAQPVLLEARRCTAALGGGASTLVRVFGLRLAAPCGRSPAAAVGSARVTLVGGAGHGSGAGGRWRISARATAGVARDGAGRLHEDGVDAEHRREAGRHLDDGRRHATAVSAIAAHAAEAEPVIESWRTCARIVRLEAPGAACAAAGGRFPTRLGLCRIFGRHSDDDVDPGDAGALAIDARSGARSSCGTFADWLESRQ